MSEPGIPISQSGILPYRRNGDGLEVLLVTSLTSRRWVIPKGHIDAPLTPRQSAEKEAFEEAGVTGRIAADSIGTYRYTKAGPKGDIAYHVEVFAMEVMTVLDVWPEDRRRHRVWMTSEIAASAVAEPELGVLIRSFAAAAGA